MRFRLFFALFLLSTVARGAEQSPSLAQTIDVAITRPPFQRASWGIEIVRENGEAIFESNAGRLFVPASNRKLFTAAFVADCIGMETQLVTPVLMRGEIRDGVLRGDLVIVGAGDPSFAGRLNPDREAFIAPLVAALREAGVRRIAGRVVADVSLFSDETIPPGWKIGYLSDYYAAPVDALAFNENVVGVHLSSRGCSVHELTLDPDFGGGRTRLACGGAEDLRYRSDEANMITVRGELSLNNAASRSLEDIAVRDPALFTAQGIRDQLTRHGISSNGAATERGEKSSSGKNVFQFVSPQLYTLMPIVLQDSQNLYAEMLHRLAGVKDGRQRTTLDAALESERQFLLSDVGIAADEFRFYDGSGLASDNVVTPHAVTQLLRYMMAPQRAGVFRPLMAHPGEGGTLRNRLKPLRDRLIGKTGSLNGVTALSGVLTSTDGSPIYFSIMANRYDGSDTMARQIIDEIVSAVAAAN